MLLLLPLPLPLPLLPLPLPLPLLHNQLGLAVVSTLGGPGSLNNAAVTQPRC